MDQTISTLLILGASGDLSSRLLLPALGQLLTKQPGYDVHLVGSGIEDLGPDAWKTLVSTAFASTDSQGPAVDSLLAGTHYQQADVTKADDLTTLLGLCTGAPAIYFALPPAVTAKVCDALSEIDLPEGTQLAMEKPFGTDERGARELNARIARLVPENQVHRVDHFLGHSTVFNILGLRFANQIFEPVWDSNHIEKVDIVFDEQLGLEGRARYYDHAGALVDMLQSHLLQVLSIVAMEPPATLEAGDLRDAKGMVLRATHVYDDDPAAHSRRARYTAGSIADRHFVSYVDEPGVDPANHTETLAEVTVGIENWRWAGVPFTLRSGKALGERRREVVITFKPAAHIPTGLTGAKEPTVLRIFIGPDKMSLELNINGPGDPYTIERVSLDATFEAGQYRAYGEVLGGILAGDPSLSVRGDTAEQCWRIVQPVLDAWRADEVPLDEYAAGSEGPANWNRVG
ncbi:glucose-6-phosphate dehydrogenase [Cryobacterium tepidiphilum]|uniref:Glucose-6-phosphate 1-dehydrogenase n=1 Tax=Cryobacterium tepidiphilum TaxID=2486026 RepID=A0A3M8L178_9MICO|nr:glucose-6-phosphate dehydrogenase [Cryobacterium tepidiphilum]RNE59291.1 glucose-6-phosphate dehydrogenase [Cryobacterium tepidiphilum]